MKLPHDKYIKTLVVGKLNNVDILKKLQKTSLIVPPVKDIESIREKLMLENEDYFLGKEKLDLDWLKELDIEAMYGYEFGEQVYESLSGIDGAFRALNDPNLYRTITVLAMANVMPSDLELILNSKYDVEYSSDDLDMFLKYFFDVRDWTMFEKEEYAAAIKDSTLRFFYGIALKEEKDYVMWKLGLAPNRTFDSMLKDMAVDSYYNFKEQTTRNPDQAQKWGNLMMKLQERIEKIEAEAKEDVNMMEDLKNAFEQVAERFKRTGSPTKEENPHSSKNVFDREVPKIINIDEILN